VSRNDAHTPQDFPVQEHVGLKRALQHIYGVLVWRRKTLIRAMMASLAAALAFLAFVPATYTATAVLLTDTRRAPELQDTGRDAPVDSSVVETQVEAIRSEVLALGVVDKLALINHPEFNTQRPGLGRLVMSFLMPASAGNPNDLGFRRRVALTNLVEKLSVRRVGRSYVAQISFTSRDPQMSARIVNAIAEGYIAEQLGARQRSQQLSNEWMDKRLRDLREEANRATEAVQAATPAAKDVTAAATPGRPAPKPTAETRELEARAQISKANYEALLARYTQSLQLQTLAVPATEARVLTLANTPDRRSFPRPSQVLLLALLGGGVLGIGGACAKEAMERRVRSRSQIQRELGLRTFPCVPRVRRGLLARGHAPLSLLTGASEKAIRHLKVAIDERAPSAGCVIVGVTSVLPHEGTTTIAYNIAKAYASAGARALLIDANAQRPGPGAKLRPTSEHGPSQALLETGAGLCIASLDILDNGEAMTGSSHPSDVLASAAAADALKEIGADYDCIVIDLPAMRDCVEANAGAAALSCIVVVAEWGRTSLDDLEAAFADSGKVLDRVLGVVINKTPARLARYVA
jgi:uncharacterized protein involved in exopolysaccharide biosynthesis/Mrp family chromosome partitioning ATPase